MGREEWMGGKGQGGGGGGSPPPQKKRTITILGNIFTKIVWGMAQPSAVRDDGKFEYGAVLDSANLDLAFSCGYCIVRFTKFCKLSANLIIKFS